MSICYDFKTNKMININYDDDFINKTKNYHVESIEQSISHHIHGKILESDKLNTYTKMLQKENILEWERLKFPKIEENMLFNSNNINDYLIEFKIIFGKTYKDKKYLSKVIKQNDIYFKIEKYYLDELYIVGLSTKADEDMLEMIFSSLKLKKINIYCFKDSKEKNTNIEKYENLIKNFYNRYISYYATCSNINLKCEEIKKEKRNKSFRILFINSKINPIIQQNLTINLIDDEEFFNKNKQKNTQIVNTENNQKALFNNYNVKILLWIHNNIIFIKNIDINFYKRDWKNNNLCYYN